MLSRDSNGRFVSSKQSKKPSILKKVVNDALTILRKPGAWTKGAFARDKHGHQVNPLSSAACKFCALGAFVKATKDNGLNVEVKGSRSQGYWLASCENEGLFTDKLEEVTGNYSVDDYNDNEAGSVTDVISALETVASKL